MLQCPFPGGVWPVMLTPFRLNGAVDEEGLSAMVQWYIAQGASGLFAICQSSEMYQMTMNERINMARCVVRASAGRLPVLASAGIDSDPSLWADDVLQMRDAGADAIILITNQFAAQQEDDATWLRNCMSFLERLPQDIPLGFYECPYPYKRLISTQNLQAIAQTGRFYFLKDTCCDEALIRRRLAAIQGTALKLYNANTTTLVPSLRDGAVGYSGVMANFHTDLYAYLCTHYTQPDTQALQAFLTLASLIERQYYPVNAKYHMNKHEGVPILAHSRRQASEGFCEAFRREVDELALLEHEMRARYLG